MTTQTIIYKYSQVDNSVVVIEQSDIVADEAALQLYIIYYSDNKPHKFHLTTLMRSFGDDEDLIIGLLFNENIISNYSQITLLSKLGKNNENLWKVELSIDCKFNPQQHQRNLLATASCGVCAQVNHPDVSGEQKTVDHNIKISLKNILFMAQDFGKYQQDFKQTGGVHGVAVYDLAANYIVSAEDIGRHNACDKVIGKLLKQNLLTNANNYCLIFSSRISYELIQKAQQAKIKIILALGAPSSLAIKLAQQYQITLIGFIRNNSFNVYSGHERIE